MSVFPAASKNFLPKTWAELMINEVNIISQISVHKYGIICESIHYDNIPFAIRVPQSLIFTQKILRST